MKNIKKIKINISTYFFAFLMLYSGYKSYLYKYLIIFIIHELGHLFFILIFKINLINIEIYPFGGKITVEKRLNIEIYKDFFVASGGFIFQIIFLFIFKDQTLLDINKWLICLNLLPLIPLDGSKILFITMSKYLSFYKSVKIFSILNLIIIFIYSCICLINNNINLLFISFCFMFILNEIKNENYILNNFYLERFLYNFKYKKVKYHYKLNHKLIKREENSYFFDKYWKNEKEILAKKFDNSSIF